MICHSTKKLIKNYDSSWIKTGLDNFDVPMGGYDLAQIADLVGLYILNTLTRIIDPIQIRLYHDDGIPNRDGPRCSSIQKKIIRAFKFLGFKIEISPNIKIANFQDVALNLADNSHRPFLNVTYPYMNMGNAHRMFVTYIHRT